MTDKLKARLEDLRNEYTAGMKAMAEIQRKQDELRTTLLRISGAIQVLEELSGEAKPAGSPESEAPST